MPLLLPITLTTASILALICAVLIARVIAARRKYQISLGDGGNADLNTRIRTHANFMEYVPLLLILMALLEMANGNRVILTLFGLALVVFRVLHAVGMPGKPRNTARAIGTGGSVLLLVIAALYGLILTWLVWSPLAAG